MSKCLYCHTETNNNSEMHEACSKKFFGSSTPPDLDLKIGNIYDMAAIAVADRVSVPGAQSKISMGVNSNNRGKSRLTVVGLWGDYILKPPSEEYLLMPEIESVTMKLAEYFGIRTVPYSLIRMKSGELAYITKRIDRVSKQKFPMEDMAQLTGKLTEHKYMGSLEQIGKAISQYSSNPGFDLLNFFEVNVFSFLTGNADMHLKNFSIMCKNNMYGLAPAYDLISTRLMISEIEDNEEAALAMNGKRRKFNREDFLRFAANLGLAPKAVENSLSAFSKKLNGAKGIISRGFLPAELAERYCALVLERAGRLLKNKSRSGKLQSGMK